MTKWFHSKDGFQHGDRLDSFELKQAQWTTRLVMLYERYPNMYPFETIFQILTTLASQNEKFLKSLTFSFGMWQIMAKYYNEKKNMKTIKYLYSLMEKMPQSVKSGWNFSNIDLNSIEAIGLNADVCDDILQSLTWYNKKMSSLEQANSGK